MNGAIYDYRYIYLFIFYIYSRAPADEGDALRDVTFPWELEQSMDEEEEEQGEREEKADLQGKPDDEVIFDPYLELWS